jgi:hypothetical protein
MVSLNSTMLRAFANSMMNAWRDFTTPMSDKTVTTVNTASRQLSYAQPSFVIQREFRPPTSLRVCDYQITNATGLLYAARMDLLENKVTFCALEKALDEYTEGVGPVKAHTVILDTGNWIGRFVIDENKNTELLVLRLVEGADMRMLKELS